MRLSDRDLVTSWLERNDAQNYVLLGDPAVRIRKDALRNVIAGYVGAEDQLRDSSLISNQGSR